MKLCSNLLLATKVRAPRLDIMLFLNSSGKFNADMIPLSTLAAILLFVLSCTPVEGSSNGACGSNPCLNGGICGGTKDGFVCTCINGYLGIRCEKKSDECPVNANIDCKHGKCRLMSNGQVSCHCFQGFGGPFCEDDLQSCKFTPCVNNGTCITNKEGYHCLCPQGFKGTHCQINSSSIVTFTNSCQSGLSTLNGGKCWEGKKTTIRVSWGYGDNLCNSLQSCFDTDAAHGVHYTDVQLKPVQMEPQQTLLFSTEDDAALYDFKFVPHILPVETESALSFLQCNKSNAVQLSHIDQSGKVLVNKTLLPVGRHFFIADLNAIHRCEFGLRLNVSVKTHDCINPSFSSKSFCSGNGICYTDYTLDSYQCKCHTSMMGKYCEKENPCTKQPCKYGGWCQVIESNSNIYEGFICHCPAGRTGMDCSELVDKCTKKPCLHGGRCITKGSKFECICAAGFKGHICEVNINECLSNPCRNGGSCIDGANSFNCICQPGFKGTLCETNLNECHSNPCKNGTCIDGVNKFSCHCAAGYSGRFCEVALDECASSPCINGKCIDLLNEYKCSCGIGFTGKYCEFKLDLCKSLVHCVTTNANSCADNGANVTCVCKDGFEGSNCAVNTDDCLFNPCGNGGMCIDRVNGFQCKCKEGFTGHLCKERKDGELTTSKPEASFGVELILASNFCSSNKAVDAKMVKEGIISDLLNLCNCSLHRNNILSDTVHFTCMDNEKMLFAFRASITNQVTIESVLCALKLVHTISYGSPDKTRIVDIRSDTSYCAQIARPDPPDSLHRDVGIVIGLVFGLLVLIAIVSLSAVKFRNVRKERVSHVTERRVKAYVNLTYEGGWVRGFDDEPVLQRITADEFFDAFDPIKQDTKV